MRLLEVDLASMLLDFESDGTSQAAALNVDKRHDVPKGELDEASEYAAAEA